MQRIKKKKKKRLTNISSILSFPLEADEVLNVDDGHAGVYLSPIEGQ